MLISALLGLIVDALNLVFSFFGGQVTTLPTFLGINLDQVLSTNIGMFYTFIDAFWPIKDCFYAFLALMSYYMVRAILRIILGQHSP